MSEFFTLSPDLNLGFSHWLLALFAVSLIGMSKAGIKGIGVLAVTLMAYVFGGRASTGLVLPLLIVGDIFAVIYYHRHTQWKYLMKLIPWMMAGVLVGVWIGKDLPEAVFKRGMALIILVSVVIMFWWDQRKSHKVPRKWWFGGVIGFLAGFTTMVGNLAGAFTNIFFLAMRLPKKEFIGTAAWLFFIINLFKLPFHIFVWKTIDIETLAIDLRLALGIAIGLLFGIYILKFIKEAQFRKLILILTAIGAILIFFR